MISFKVTHRSESHWAKVITGVSASAATIRAGVFAGQSVSGVPLVDVATFNELGTVNAPARPFISPGVRRVRAEVTSLLAKAAAAAVVGRPDETRQRYHEAGKLMVDSIRTQIDTGEYAPLAASTIRRKGHDRPLVYSGRMRAAVTYEVK